MKEHLLLFTTINKKHRMDLFLRVDKYILKKLLALQCISLLYLEYLCK